MFNNPPEIYWVSFNCSLSIVATILGFLFISFVYHLKCKGILKQNQGSCFESTYITFHGYKWTMATNIIFLFLNIATILPPILILVVSLNQILLDDPLLDDDNSVNHWRNRAQSLVVLFMSSLFMGLIRYYLSERLKTAFMIRCDFSKCTHIQGWVKKISPCELRNLVDEKGYLTKLSNWFFNFSQSVSCILRNNKKNYTWFISEVNIDEVGLRYFTTGLKKYIYSEETNSFFPQTQSKEIKVENILDITKNGGLDSSKVLYTRAFYGTNEFPLKLDSFFTSIKRNILNMIVLIQYMMTIVSLFIGFTSFSVLWGILVLYGIIRTIIDERRNQRKLKEMINNIQSSNVYVKREHKKISIDSQDIVPMDVVLLSEGDNIQCDLVLVKGYLLVDESSLTGESISVLKKPITVNLNSNNINTKIEFCNPIYRDSILLAGTKVIKFYDQDELSKQKEMAECIALNTGAFTYRSEIINSVLIEDANEINFHRNLPLLWTILLIISFILIMNQFIMMNWALGSFFIAIGTSMQLLPIWAPACVTKSLNSSSKRLEKFHNILTSIPQRIPFASQMTTFFFDKTGTLTTLEYNLKLIHPFNEYSSEMECSTKINPLLFSALCTCHSLYPKTFNEELFYGDAMEIAMFGYTNYRIHIIQANNKLRRFIIPKYLNINHDILSSNEGFEIIWNFGFDHFKRLMSVIVKCKRTGRIFLFTKGAFEAILNISEPRTIPSDFKTLAEKYSANGSYTIAIAYRDITHSDLNNLENIQRSIFEVSMIPLGILSFINIIRKEAATTIKSIQDSNIRCIILTGDHLQSALSVARRVGLLKDNKIKDNSINYYTIPVENEDYIILNGELINNNFTLFNEKMEIVPYNEIIKDLSKYLLALTADAYNAMEDIIVSSEVQGNIIDDKQGLLKVVTLKDLIYSRIVIIARSSPEDKCKVVSDFTKYGEITGMIGDGSNDSAAMRVSHVGVTLTNHSTTVIAPFAITSNNLLDISNLIAEGHNCAVTSHSLYLYMLLSGILVVFCKNILLYFAQANIPMMGYSYYDLVVNLPSMWSLTHCKTKTKLASYKPETSLISLNSLYTIGSIFSIVIIFYCVILFRASSQPWFTPSYTRNISLFAYVWPRQHGFEPAMTWLWLCFLHSHMSIVFGFGGDHREPFYKNKILLFTWSIAQLGLLWLTFSSPNPITCWFSVNCINEIPNYFSIFNLYKIEFPKFVAPAGHNVFPLSWKFEFTFWVTFAASLMGLSYYYFFSRGNKVKLKKRV